MNTRPYIVTDKAGIKRLVQAASPAQALRHVVTEQFTVKAANGNEVLTLIGEGVLPEVAEKHAEIQEAQA